MKRMNRLFGALAQHMEVGADYHDLAGFYRETGEKEKSIQIAQKGLKKATGRMDG